MDDAKTLGEILSAPIPEPERLPVLNSEPRVLMDGRKWHLLWERDGFRCLLCGIYVPKGTGEVDHIVPRSSFAADRLHIADRSDNLQITCVDCNQEKSNYAPTERSSCVGVTSRCWECTVGLDDDGYHDVETFGDRPEMTVPAYCGRCGFTWVPDASWLL